ncbi:DUF4097 family beta strand repeat-containing protein [Halobaculum limi]|uniref:DUF4097 family beta strand repeat-containing protein n=1 Tax=Halobaculum limi TaxID=3031916 RepID=UPI0024063405|nr:DUF4097 family beta strand repeat-containing protein [Halobaculum sp. YSMS11]
MNKKQSPTLTRRTVLGLGATLATTSLAGCLGGFSVENQVSERSTASFDPATVSTIRVTNAIGDVTVEGAATDRIGVDVIKASGDGQVGLDRIVVKNIVEDGVLTVATRINDSDRTRAIDRESATISVRVPRAATALTVASVESAVGDIRIGNTRGDTIVRGGVGDIDVQNVDGFLSVRSGVGDVRAVDVTGIDSITSEVGDVTVDLFGIRRGVDISTLAGDISVDVANDLDFDLVAETSSRIDSDLELTRRSGSSTRLAGRQNRGGHRLTVRSDVGRIAFRTVRR